MCVKSQRKSLSRTNHSGNVSFRKNYSDGLYKTCMRFQMCGMENKSTTMMKHLLNTSGLTRLV
eukprot:UN07908